MKKATATYICPQGDNKVVEMGGVTFFDGKSVDLNTDDNGLLIGKLVTNQHFDIEVSETDEPSKKKAGRPSNAEIAERKAAAEKKAAEPTQMSV